MLDNFQNDLARGHKAEKIVLDVFSQLTDKYKFDWVGNNREYYYKGDIIATDKESGKQIFIEVKNDSRIADTGNVLCEEEVLYFDNGLKKKGNMYCSGDIFAVVSEKEQKIYVMDYKVLRNKYRNGKYKEIQHPQQITYCYLCSIE